MSRSVARPADPGAFTVYALVDDAAIDAWGWDTYWAGTLAYMQSMACRAWPSMGPADDWADDDDDELRVIARNSLASLVVSVYCGLVSVSLVPDRGRPLSRAWVSKTGQTLRKLVHGAFGDVLYCAGVFSTGEAFFERYS